MTLEEARQLARRGFEDRGFGELSERLADLVRPCLQLSFAVTGDDALPVGASKIGGQPDLPDGFDWPTFGEEPLAFLAQIDLGEVSRFPVCRDLPGDGLLLFFFAVDARAFGGAGKQDGWRIVHVQGPLQRRVSPSPHVFGAGRIGYSEDFSFPMPGTLDLYGLNVGDDWEAYLDGCGQVAVNGSRRQMFGYPGEFNGGMEISCHIESNALPQRRWDEERTKGDTLAERWRMILSLETDERTGMDWGDMGVIAFWLREADLLECRFDRAWLSGECS